MAKTTPKDFFLWAGAMVALYWSVIAFLGLMFDYINYAFPNSLAYVPADPYQSGISYEMASLIVLFPLFAALMYFIHRDIKNDATRGETWVRRWAIFLTLFVAGVTMAGDLIWLLTSFLNGTDLTAPFFFKAAILFLVAAAGFMHFIADFWGYWEKFPERARSVGYAAGLLVALSVLSGFVIFGTPMQARLALFDQQKVTDLQTIQYQIVNYWQTKQVLPATLADLQDPISGFNVPIDPQSGARYEYTATGKTSFELCAVFNAAGFNNQNGMTVPVMAPASAPYGVVGKPVADNWVHAAGRACFDRTIDPSRYPPLTK